MLRTILLLLLFPLFGTAQCRFEAPADSLLRQAVLALDAHDYPRAETYAEPLLAIDHQPSAEERRWLVGLLYERTGKPDKSRSLLENLSEQRRRDLSRCLLPSPPPSQGNPALWWAVGIGFLVVGGIFVMIFRY